MNAFGLILVAIAVAHVSAVSADARARASATAADDHPVGAATPAEQSEAALWPLRLGSRVVSIEHYAPLQDRVVLVPDEATFLNEIGQWSPKGRWPVLIEDPVYTPMFIRAFAPRQVVRRTEPGVKLDGAASLQTAMQSAVVRAFGGDPARDSIVDAMAAAGFTPLGLAAYAADDPAFVAAAALAAGRGLVPVPIEGNFGAPNDQLDFESFTTLDRAVQDAFAETRLPFAELGDSMDALVLCRNIAHATALDSAVKKIPAAPGIPEIKSGEPFATSDALCRSAEGSRYAVCGTIHGSSARSAYAAMASLFLRRTSIWAIDSYQSDDPIFRSFSVASLDSGLETAGFVAMTRFGARAGLGAWRELLSGTFSCDMLFLNSSGNADFFDLGTPGKTPATSSAAPGDVPVLVRPLALGMVHSFSLQRPSDRETVGGRWLENGVYAYAGSVHEPFLFAFVPPGAFLERLANGAPFGYAARVWEGPFSRSWRVALMGDPLMMCVAPRGLPERARIDPPPTVPGQLDLIAECRELLSKCKGDTTGDATQIAMRCLATIGQDRLVAELWRVVSGRPWAARVAPLALESLFAQRNAQGFLSAYALTAAPTDRQRDMLWQLCAPVLTTVRNPDQLLLFENAVRVSWPSKDLERILPSVRSTFGPLHARELVLKVQRRTKNPQYHAALQEILKGI